MQASSKRAARKRKHSRARTEKGSHCAGCDERFRMRHRGLLDRAATTRAASSRLGGVPACAFPLQHADQSRSPGSQSSQRISGEGALRYGFSVGLARCRCQSVHFCKTPSSIILIAAPGDIVGCSSTEAARRQPEKSPCPSSKASTRAGASHCRRAAAGPPQAVARPSRACYSTRFG
ncbi:hypothetical protein BDV96DRAFT_250815 [Lophiotrema nucula]|uniref:Uncharacterized protein n=1 Tax=Lophiotrema nucula TaxID=690887 RepID=A0A6A5YPM8_9PLEO|nr:hypothetical protein BDV96DRAFT_250815 [Lophiotrema nucula]